MVEVPGKRDEIHITIQERVNPAFCLAIQLEEEEYISPSAWYYDIWNLLNEYKYLDNTDKGSRVALRRLASHFIISAKKLF